MFERNMITEIKSPEDYKLKVFGDLSDAADAQKIYSEALKQALDIRKFEIDLYWKRANYFWLFIGASFGGYFGLVSSERSDNLRIEILILSSIGFMFSYFWYWVNRGSKFWQDNWERHVDYLEDLCSGALYKVSLNPINKSYNILSDYPISVTKINQLLSFIISLLWFSLTLNALNRLEIPICCSIFCSISGALILTLIIRHACLSRIAYYKSPQKEVKFIKREL